MEEEVREHTEILSDSSRSFNNLMELSAVVWIFTNERNTFNWKKKIESKRKTFSHLEIFKKKYRKNLEFKLNDLKTKLTASTRFSHSLFEYSKTERSLSSSLMNSFVEKT